MADATTTTASSWLKEIYTPVRIREVMYTRNPLLALIPKDETFEGIDVKQPIITANPAGRSATFSVAQAAAQPSNSSAFTLTRVKDYAVATIQRDLLKASKSDKGAFLRATQPEIQGALNNIRRATAVKLYRSGTGTVAQGDGSSSIAANPMVFTLKNPRDIKFIENGMCVAFSSGDGTGTLRTATSKASVVASVDRQAGTFTMSAGVTASGSYSTTVLNGDYVLMSEGDFAASLSGLDAWLVPYTAAGASRGLLTASFFGVTRTLDTIRLAGVARDDSQVSIEEAILNLANDIIDLGDGDPDHFFLTPTAYTNLVKELGAKVRYGEAAVEDADVRFGFKGVVVEPPNGGEILCVPDYNCRAGVGYMLTLDTWKLRSLGGVPEQVDEDGVMILRGATSDNFEVRFAEYLQLGCEAPGYNGTTMLNA